MLQQLGAEALFKAGRQAGTQWTQLMDECLEQAASKLGRTPADVQAALHATPFHPALVALLRRLTAAGGGGGNAGMDGSTNDGSSDSGAAAGGGGSAIDVAVISDANTVRARTEMHTGRLHTLQAQACSSCPECPGSVCGVEVHASHRGAEVQGGQSLLPTAASKPLLPLHR